MIRKLTHRKNKLFMLGFVIVLLLVANVILWTAHIATLIPYAITDSENNVICVVKSHETAKKVMNDILSCMTEDGTEIAAVDSGYHIERAEGGQKAVSVQAAAQAILDAAEEDKSDITIVSTKTETKDFTPAPVYEKDETMFAGEAKVLEDGEDGAKEVYVAVTTVNGETKETTEITKEVLSEGSPQVIAKGTRGLPKDESWEYYDGDPVANNGDDIVATATEYVGKVPYVWGGKNLETGVDCSGFVIAIYRKYGVSLNYPLYKEGVGVSYADAQPGDVLYFPGHYGIYIGDGMMVHASNKRVGVTIGGIGSRKILAVRRIVTDQ